MGERPLGAVRVERSAPDEQVVGNPAIAVNEDDLDLRPLSLTMLRSQGLEGNGEGNDFLDGTAWTFLIEALLQLGQALGQVRQVSAEKVFLGSRHLGQGAQQRRFPGGRHTKKDNAQCAPPEGQNPGLSG